MSQIEEPAQPERRMSYTEKYGAGYGVPQGAPAAPPMVSGLPEGAYAVPRDHWAGTPHPSATTALVLGIVGLTVCGFAAPFAWYVGGKAVRDIDYSRGRLSGRGTANAGRILGIIGTVIIVLGIVFVALVVAGGIGSARRNGY